MIPTEPLSRGAVRMWAVRMWAGLKPAPTVVAAYRPNGTANRWCHGMPRASSDDRVASFLEDAEGSCAHRYEVSVTITDSGLDGGNATCAVDDLGGAGDPTLPHGTEEVDVEADGRRPQADERGHREPHGVVQEGGVDPSVQRPVAVEVDVFHVYVADGLPRLDLLDPAPYVTRESNLLVEVPGEPGQLFFVRVSCYFFHKLSFWRDPENGNPSVSRPAVDVEHLAAHERGLLGGEVQDGGGHVLGPTGAADGDALYALGDEVVEIHAESGRGLTGHLRLYKAR